MSRYLATGALLLLSSFAATALAQATDPTQLNSSMRKASHWIGRHVTTPDGVNLGQVEDFAIDQTNGSITFVVVSVGSFLIENNLIAVAPDALRPAPGMDSVLVLEADADNLRQAKRFTNNDWPRVADVVRSGGAPAVPALPEGYVPPEGAPASGTASITDGLRTAYLTPDEASIQTRLEDIPNATRRAVRIQARPTRPRADATNKFDRLDADGDQALDRAEIALEISPDDKYSDLDVDSSGFIERDEFDAFQERLEREY